MEFAQIINSGYDLIKINVYNSFTEYFNNPLLFKIKNIDNFSTYMTKIHALYGNSYKYLILFVTKDSHTVGNKKYMSDIEWVYLQTRILEDNHNILVHNYKPVVKPPLDQKINLENRKEDHVIYKAEKFPLHITLLHTKNNKFQYQSTVNIISALETYQTIINFI